MSNSLGSFLENPQINNELCRVAAEVFGDCLRTKAGLNRKSTSEHPDMLQIYNAARQDNSFSEDLIKKFQDRLMILLIKNYPYERKVLKSYQLPAIIKEAADFDGFNLEREQLPNFIQMNVNGHQIVMLPVGEITNLRFNLVYDAYSKEWI